MPLYTFTDGTTPDQFTFTNCGKTGTTGPSLSQCRTSYGGSLNDGSWWNDNSNNWLDMTTTGIQRWKPPTSGTYEISASGADGGYGGGTFGPSGGGQGAFVKISVELTNDDYINIVCGQTSSTTNPDNNGSGGGGGNGISGSIGALRIIWGSNRSFPSTNTQDM